MSRRTMIPIAAVAILLLVFLVSYKVIEKDPACAVTLHVTSSTEKDELVASLAEDYNAARRELRGGGCARVEAAGETSGRTKSALAEHWKGHKGSRPDVWLPSSSMWVDLLRQEEPDEAPATTRWASIAQSPVVVAVPRDLAAGLGWPAKRFSWAQLLEPRPGRSFYVGREDPRTSTSGLASTISAYYAATSGELDAAKLEEPAVQAYVRRVEANVVQRGFVQDDIMNLLRDQLGIDQGQASTDAPISAIVLQEQLIHLYNTMNLEADPQRLRSGVHESPNQPLVPIYPTDGTMMLDHPYVVLPSAEEDGAVRDAADDFRAFLRADPARKLFLAAGFRDADGRAGQAMTAVTPVPANARQVGDGRTGLLIRDSPDAATIQAVLANREGLKKRAQLLMVMDESGTMDRPAASGTEVTRGRAAQDAAANSVQLLDPRDRVGLWFFHSLGNPPRTEKLPVTELGDDDGFRVALRDLKPTKDKDTALYVSVRDAHRRMVRDYRPDSINAVIVLTDGVNDYDKSRYSLDQLVRDLKASDRTRPVRVYCIAFGETAAGGKAALDRISGATGAGRARDALDPAAVEKVFGDIVRDATKG